MPQSPFSAKPPLGVIYNTSMDRPDAALALALLYGFESKRESRIGSVCVVGSGLKTAIFCDIVAKFYQLGPTRNANQVLPVGLAAVNPLPPDSPMVQPVVEGQYPHTVKRLSDTSLAEAVIRNGVIFNSDAVVILSSPATYLAKSLDLLGTKDLYRDRVRQLVIVDNGAPQRDPDALRKVIANWPTAVFYCGREVGEQAPFPGAAIEKDFAWSTAHPVVEAYRAYKSMPYDARGWDLAAAHYAVHPDAGFFQVSEPGTLTVRDDGRMQFEMGGAGTVRSLTIVPTKKDEFIAAIVGMVSAKPLPPQQRFRPPSNAVTPPPPPAKK
jgi:hypothetical protein